MRPTTPLLPEYGNWRVEGPSTRVGTAKRSNYYVRCVCIVHGTERMILESDLRSGVARKCMRCVRSRCAPRGFPRQLGEWHRSEK
jgi:hypothetical protein